MSEFEEYIKARCPVDYDSLKEKYPNVHVCEFYRDEQDLWDLKQAEIDDLEKQLDMMKYINDEQSKNIQNAFKTIEIEQGFKDELQKRIDAVKAIMNEYYTGSFDESAEMAGLISLALRGEHE